MGGCCCSSRKPQFHGAPMYYYYPQDSEEHESLTSHDGISTTLPSDLLIDLGLNMSIPDTYRSPPAPIPYDVLLGQPRSIDVESGGSLGKPGCMDLNDGNCRNHLVFHPLSAKELELELPKSHPFSVSAEDEDDACPTCLEEYDKENPKIATKCAHHFHLACILEWMERSDTCPICDQEMIYETL